MLYKEIKNRRNDIELGNIKPIEILDTRVVDDKPTIQTVYHGNGNVSQYIIPVSTEDIAL